MTKTVVKLSVVFFLIALIASRLGLVLHEFCGHGVTGKLLGYEIGDYFLYLFSGGRISFPVSKFPLVHALPLLFGGIGAEIIAGILFLCQKSFRRAGLLRFSLIAIGSMYLIHSGVCLTRETHYGFGDFRILHWILWPFSRHLVVILLSILVVGLTARLAYLLGGELSFWLGKLRPAIFLLSFLIAASVAAGVHLGLAVSEERLFPDLQFKKITRDAAVERAMRESDQAKGLLPAERKALRKKLIKQYEPFNLDLPLYGSLFLAIIMGLYRAARRNRDVIPSPPSWRRIRILLWPVGVSLLIVLLLRSPRRDWSRIACLLGPLHDVSRTSTEKPKM